MDRYFDPKTGVFSKKATKLFGDVMKMSSEEFIWRDWLIGPNQEEIMEFLQSKKDNFKKCDFDFLVGEDSLCYLNFSFRTLIEMIQDQYFNLDNALSTAYEEHENLMRCWDWVIKGNDPDIFYREMQYASP